MGKFTIEPKELFTGKNFRTVEIEEDGKNKTYTVGINIRKEFMWNDPSILRKGVAKFNRALLPYADWKNDKLFVFTNPERTKVYAEINPDWCVDYSHKAYANTFFAEKEDEATWTIYCPEASESHTIGYAMAVIGGVALDLFNDKVSDTSGVRENSPGLFCDAVYNMFANRTDFEGQKVSDDEIASKFAENADSMAPLFGDDGSFEDESPVDEKAIEIDGYWTWKSCISGEHRIDYDWAPEAVEHIPPLSTLDHFVPTPEFISMLSLAEYSLGKIKARMEEGMEGEEALGDDAVNLKLSGPPGSGKSYALKCLAAVLGMPFWVTSFNPNSDESFAEGKTRMVGAEPRHTDAPLTMCQMYGGISAGEEPNTGDPEMIFGVYSQIVESPYTLYRNGCEAVVRHPLSIYAILYNKNCGSATMHAALLNRFNQPFKFEAADKNTFVSMLLKKAGSTATGDVEDVDKLYNKFAHRRTTFTVTPKRLCNWVYDAYSHVINGLDSSSGRDAAESISLRSCFGVIQAIQAGEEPTSALRCLTDNIGDFDEELETSIKNALSDALRTLM